MMTSKDYEEKRDFIRIKVDTPVSMIMDGGQHHEGACKNLSGAGMLLEVPQQLGVGTELQVEINGPGDRHEPLRAQVEVTRVGNGGAEGKYILGVKILKILN